MLARLPGWLWMMAVSVIIPSILSSTPALSAPESRCGELFRPVMSHSDEFSRKRIEKILKENLRDFLKLVHPTSFSSIHLSFFPILGPWHVIDQTLGSPARELWKVPFRVARKDGGIIAGAFLVSEVNSRLVIESFDFDEKTRDFENEIGKKNYVMVNIFEKGDRLHGVPSFDFRSKYSKFEKTFYIEAQSHEELVTQLRAIREKHGPIHGMEVFGHGSRGRMDLANGTSVTNPNWRYRDIFEKNGKIKLSSCEVGNGPQGEEFTKSIGETFLDKGGTVYSSKVIFSTNLFSSFLSNRLGVPEAVTEKTRRMKNIFSLSPQAMEFSLFLHLLNDENFPSDPVRKTVISPQQ